MSETVLPYAWARTGSMLGIVAEIGWANSLFCREVCISVVVITGFLSISDMFWKRYGLRPIMCPFISLPLASTVLITENAILLQPCSSQAVARAQAVARDTTWSQLAGS